MKDKTFGTCTVCGCSFKTKPSHLKRRKTCGKKCDSIRRKSVYRGQGNPNYGNKGPNNPIFKGETKVTNHGYRLIYKPDHPNARKNGYILEHRHVMAEFLQRPLEEYEDVHHKDGNKLNNKIENLEVLTRSEHTTLHNNEKELIRDSKGRIKDVIQRIPSAQFTEVDSLGESDRGAGGFGSTGVRESSV